MSQLFGDIETIPSQKPGMLEKIIETIKPPGNIKKAESIDKWLVENAAAAAEEKWKKTALDGAQGEVICATFALNDLEPFSVSRNLGESETDMLEDLFDKISQVLIDNNVGQFTRVIHGSKELFDLRFLYKRCVILGVKPRFDLCQDRRANCEVVFDTMTAWAGWGNFCSLDSICEALGVISPKGKMCGSEVWDYVQAGKVAEVVEYNRDDVVALREIYQRMHFMTPFNKAVAE